MMPPALCRRLFVVLALLAAAAIWFYQRQNSGAHVGGAISLPKMLWLAYALAAWFVMPFFLWRDARLDARVRRLFRVFWALMIARGVAEMVLLFAIVHWNPWYGISHDLACVLAILALRGGTAPADIPSRRALRFSGSILVSLVAEMAFAGMFLQTGAHEKAVYFASAEASWGYINLVTTAVLCFAYPDLGATLIALYWPGVPAETPRVLRWGRAGAGGLAAAVALSALGFWTWMMRQEAEAKRYQEIGYRIVDSCMTFKDDFVKGDEAAMSGFVEGGDLAWERVPVAHPRPFDLRRWKDVGPRAPFLRSLIDWRRGIPEVLQAAFKIHLVDEIVSDREAVAQLRFEVTGGRHTTDAGLVRCRFHKGDDGRWRVTAASVLEGTSVAGPGNLFVDRAAERGLDFTMEPDRRFVPRDRCTGHACPGPTKLKFQTMRHAYAGCATGDYDGDGWDDVFFCSGGRPALYRNRGEGTFENVTERAGLGGLWHVNTAGFADLDNDGRPDLFMAAFYGGLRLFRNNGDGTFNDVTAASGLARDTPLVTCFCFFDYDNDGRLDLYLGRFLEAREEIPDSFLYARNGQPNILYRNEGTLRFTDVTARAGVGDRGLTLALAAADYDGDGRQDLYVANDFGRNVLYRNQGDGTFRDVALETGTLAIGGSMSASWGDYDNDGRLDLYVGAIRSNQRWFVQPVTARRVVYKFIREGKLGIDNPIFSDLRQVMGDNWVNVGNVALAGNSLLRQNPDGTFTDRAEAAGARPAGWYWGSGFFDIDNDGTLDIYATDGWITGKKPHDL